MQIGEENFCLYWARAMFSIVDTTKKTGFRLVTNLTLCTSGILQPVRLATSITLILFLPLQQSLFPRLEPVSAGPSPRKSFRAIREDYVVDKVISYFRTLLWKPNCSHFEIFSKLLESGGWVLAARILDPVNQHLQHENIRCSPNNTSGCLEFAAQDFLNYLSWRLFFLKGQDRVCYDNVSESVNVCKRAVMERQRKPHQTLVAVTV